MQTAPLAGTGPYEFTERAQGAYIRFGRVPYQHWRASPDFSELEMRWQRDASARLASLEAGDVDVTTLPEDALAEAQQRGFEVVVGKVPASRVFFNVACCWTVDWKDPSTGYKYPDSPLLDPNVRKALNKAINGDELNKAFFGNKGELMIVNDFHPTRLGWNPDWEKRFPEGYGYDPAAAKALLSKAGYSPGNLPPGCVQARSSARCGARPRVRAARADAVRSVIQFACSVRCHAIN